MSSPTPTAFRHTQKDNVALWAYPANNGYRVYKIKLSKCNNFELEKKFVSFIVAKTQGKAKRKINSYLERIPDALSK